MTHPYSPTFFLSPLLLPHLGPQLLIFPENPTAPPPFTPPPSINGSPKCPAPSSSSHLFLFLRRPGASMLPIASSPSFGFSLLHSSINGSRPLLHLQAVECLLHQWTKRYKSKGCDHLVGELGLVYIFRLNFSVLYSF